MMGPVLKVSELKKSYGAIQAVKGVSLEVREGEVVTACQQACPTTAILPSDETRICACFPALPTACTG